MTSSDLFQIQHIGRVDEAEQNICSCQGHIRSGSRVRVKNLKISKIHQNGPGKDNEQLFVCL